MTPGRNQSIKKALLLWGIAGLLACASGCTDDPESILRDEKNAASEAVDVLSKIQDEPSARVAVNMLLKKLKAKWDAIQKRREDFLKMASNQETLLLSLHQVEADYVNEIEGCQRRLQNEAGRVLNISMSDFTLQHKAQNFAKEVFGGKGLLLPKDPVQSGKKTHSSLKEYWDEKDQKDGGPLIPRGYEKLIYIDIFVFLITTLATWALFVKAGEPGWAALVPIYNVIVLVKIGGMPAWMAICIIPPFHIWIYMNVARNFNKGVVYGVVLGLLFPVVLPALAFGESEYRPKKGLLFMEED